MIYQIEPNNPILTGVVRISIDLILFKISRWELKSLMHTYKYLVSWRCI